MKPFFITIDTEGDNLWNDPDVIKTENSLFIPRFQELCERYQFVPVWLTDYEMAMDDRFVSYITPKLMAGLCEIGVHLHAKNTPPLYTLSNEKGGAAYLIEYPVSVMEEKLVYLLSFLRKRFGVNIYTHRAGRWALNQEYINLLIKHGIIVDCSVTPGISWTQHKGITPGGKGADYSQTRAEIYPIDSTASNCFLYEIPVTIKKCKKLVFPHPFSGKGFLRSGYHYLKKSPVWLRSRQGNLEEMKYLLRTVLKEDGSYAEYMIHSSELMPGGSPTFPDRSSIEAMYKDLNSLFSYAKGLGFYGISMLSYVEGMRKNNEIYHI